MTKTNSKVVNRLITEINNSRTSRFREKITAITSNKQWEVDGITRMTLVEEYEAWQAYGKDLQRQKDDSKGRVAK